MRMLWGALRAVSVETMGILVVLWMLHGATDFAIDLPWRTITSDDATVVQQSDGPTSSLAWLNNAPSVNAAATVVASDDPEPRRATLRQWFNTLFPASVTATIAEPTIARRADYTRERLDHYSRLYGLAARD